MSRPQSPTPLLPEPYWTALWADPEMPDQLDAQPGKEAEKSLVAALEAEFSDA
jgi:hypothetical protein